MTTTMHISHQKVKLYTVETSISGAIARLHGTYGLATFFWFVQGGGGDSCLFAAFRTTKTSPTVGYLPVLLNIGSSHERNSLIVHCNSLTNQSQ